MILREFTIFYDFKVGWCALYKHLKNLKLNESELFRVAVMPLVFTTGVGMYK